MTAQAILYIHGFNSSPLSEKATMTEHYLAEAKPQCHWRVPRLPCLPDEAIAYLREYIESWSNELAISPNEIALIGSSLGGYYAAHLATMYQQKAWLVNPAMHPYRLLVDYLGVQTNPYTGEVFELTAEN
ncbi:alpha/beta hydrolase fold domain-containing protein, partial [bacterium]|nr:alpha/beta hydrolase fold domain-containing protein [bacterium]